MKVAVAGMGVSGLAVAGAALKLGASATVLDERPNDSAASLAATDRLGVLGAEAVTGWHGRLEPADYDVLVVSPGFPEDHPSVLAMQAAGKEVWGEIEFAFRIARAPILAVTGTNGKSTTAVLAWMLARAAGLDARLCGNIAGSGYPEAALTTAALEAGPDAWLVAEVSSFQLAFVPSFRARAATITNVTSDHMDRHKDFDHYYQAKLNIFANSTVDDVAVFNADEAYPKLEDVRSRHRGRVVSVSPSGAAHADGAARYREGVMQLGSHSLEVHKSGLTTPFDVANAMVAWELVAPFADPGAAGVEALRGFRGLANRMERVAERGGVLFVNNSMCTNPAAFVSSSKGLPRRQRILLGGVTKGVDYAPVGEYLRSAGHSVYLFGPGQDAWRDVLGMDAPGYPSLEAALEAAAAEALPGEAVLLNPGGASAEPYANFRERGEAFCRAVRALGGSDK